MGKVSLDFGEPPGVLDPPIGIYSCVLCDVGYSRKAHLNQHYRQAHQGILPDYRGGKKQPVLKRVAENENMQQSLNWVYNLPSSTIQLIALLVFIWVYYNVQ